MSGYVVEGEEGAVRRQAVAQYGAAHLAAPNQLKQLSLCCKVLLHSEIQKPIV